VTVLLEGDPTLAAPPASGLEGLAQVHELPVDAGRARYLHRLVDEGLKAGTLTPAWQGLLGAMLGPNNDGEPGRVAAVAASLAAVQQVTAAPPGFTWVGGEEIAKPLPPRIYPLHGFAMAAGPPTLFFAYSFGGKTIILQDMLLSLAAGVPVWQQFRCYETVCLHIDHEQGKHETFDRYQRLARARHIDIAALGDRLRVCSLPPYYLNSPGAEDLYKRALEGVGVALVDTFGAATPGDDENDGAIRRGLDLLTRVSECTGTLIIVAHHMGKFGLSKEGKTADPRTLAKGNSSILAAAGYAYAIGGGKGEPKIVQQVKARGLGDPFTEDFYLELGGVDVRAENPEWNPSTSTDPGGFVVRYQTVEQVHPPAEAAASAFERAADAVIDALTKAGRSGLSTRGLRVDVREMKIKARNEQIDEAAERLMKTGRIVRRQVGKAMQWFIPDQAPPVAQGTLIAP
jgi:hypothetical protein